VSLDDHCSDCIACYFARLAGVVETGRYLEDPIWHIRIGEIAKEGGRYPSPLNHLITFYSLEVRICNFLHRVSIEEARRIAILLAECIDVTCSQENSS
jgi:hypothetical protein